MQKIELIIGILAAISLLGLIALMSMGKDVSVIVPILTALISFLIGSRKEQIIAGIRGKK